MSEKRIPQRKDIPEEQRWNLTPLFESDSAWETLFLEIESELESYSSFRGRLQESVNVFREAIEFHLDITRKIDRVYTYAHLRSDEDKSNQFYLGLHQRAISLFTRASELSSFLTPEIQSLGDEVINLYIEDQSLSEYRFYLQKILRYKPHTRNEAEEKILAMSREVANASSQV
ncbi:MAG: oligoendopeptidase F, partial [Desulfobacterales bacterium]